MCLGLFVIRSSLALAAKKRDLNNFFAFIIFFRLALRFHPLSSGALVNGCEGFELLLRHSFEYELFKLGRKVDSLYARWPEEEHT